MGYVTTWPLFTSAGTPPPAPIIVVRPPLPPFDPDTTDPDTSAPLPVYTTLRAAPPATADVRWWRGDAWGLTVPGLPRVPGGAEGPAQSRVLTYFLDRYGREWEDEILRLHRDYGYTHISLSPQDSFAAGQSEDDYVAMSVRCRQAGLFVHHLMRSKYYTPASAHVTTARWDPTLNLLRDRWRRPPQVAPASPELSVPAALIERLLREGAMQVETPAWEMNYWSPSVCRAMIDHDAALIGTRCQIRLHFYPHYISWQENDESPTDFWRANYGRVDGVLYQCDPYWTAGMMAARTTDCLDRLASGGLWGLGDSGRGHPIDLTVWETVATCQFGNGYDGDGRLADEDIGNLKGFECGNAPGMMTVQGYGNGGRRPDGTAL
jgi:hypothetical protein